MTPLLSIIIPIYNVENTLKRCVASILSQSFTDYELLLIDDGSPDRCGAMIDNMAMKDIRIHVFHKENGGVSDTRNFGIARANGKYITFVDSDDELAPNTLLPLMQEIKSIPQCDILEYPVLQNPEHITEHKISFGHKIYKNSLLWLKEGGCDHCWVWNKIYRRELIKEIRFPVGKIYEDIFFMAYILRQKPIICTTDYGLYLYHLNPNGLGAVGASHGLVELLEAQMFLTQILNIDTRHPHWHRMYLSMFTTQLHAYCATGKTVLPPQRVKLRNYGNKVLNIKAILLNIFGLNLSCKLYKLHKGK